MKIRLASATSGLMGGGFCQSKEKFVLVGVEDEHR